MTFLLCLRCYYFPVLLVLFALVPVHARAMDEVILNKLKHFEVANLSKTDIKTVAFKCQPVEDGNISCNTTSTTISYYKWKKDDSKREPRRCSISGGSTSGESYKLSAAGVWTRQERGGFCSALIEEIIKLTPEGVTYEEVTLDNKIDEPLCLEAHGKVGNITHYNPHYFLDILPMSCTSMTVSP